MALKLDSNKYFWKKKFVADVFSNLPSTPSSSLPPFLSVLGRIMSWRNPGRDGGGGVVLETCSRVVMRVVLLLVLEDKDNDKGERGGCVPKAWTLPAEEAQKVPRRRTSRSKAEEALRSIARDDDGSLFVMMVGAAYI